MQLGPVTAVAQMYWIRYAFSDTTFTNGLWWLIITWAAVSLLPRLTNALFSMTVRTFSCSTGRFAHASLSSQPLLKIRVDVLFEVLAMASFVTIHYAVSALSA